MGGAEEVEAALDEVSVEVSDEVLQVRWQPVMYQEGCFVTEESN